MEESAYPHAFVGTVALERAISTVIGSSGRQYSTASIAASILTKLLTSEGPERERSGESLHFLTPSDLISSDISSVYNNISDGQPQFSLLSTQHSSLSVQTILVGRPICLCNMESPATDGDIDLDVAGAMYIEDASTAARLICEFSCDTTPALNNWNSAFLIVCTKFSFVGEERTRRGSAPHLEVCRCFLMGSHDIIGGESLPRASKRRKTELQRSDTPAPLTVAWLFKNAGKRDGTVLNGIKMDVEGCVIAKSPIHKFRGSCFFFVELADRVQARNDSRDAAIVSMMVIFKDGHSCCHGRISVGLRMLFTQLSKSCLFRGKPTEQTLFRASTLTTVSVLSPNLAKSGSLRLSDAGTLNLGEATVGELRRVIRLFRGIITEVPRNEAGTYELNGSLAFYFGHCPNHNNARGFRVGATLELRNVHVAYGVDYNIDVHHGTVVPVVRAAGLAACSYSTVAVAAFSESTAMYIPLIKRKSLFTLHCRKMNMMECLCTYRLCEQLYKKLVDCHLPLLRADSTAPLRAIVGSDSGNSSSPPGILGRILALLPHVPYNRNIYTEFCRHDHECRLAEPCTNNIWPWIPMFKDFKHLILVRFQNLGAGRLFIRVKPRDICASGTLLVGILQSGARGGLELSDKSSSINLRCIGLSLDERECIGAVIAIDSFTVVVENVPGMGSLLTYAEFDAASIRKLHPSKCRARKNDNPCSRDISARKTFIVEITALTRGTHDSCSKTSTYVEATCISGHEESYYNRRLALQFSKETELVLLPLLRVGVKYTLIDIVSRIRERVGLGTNKEWIVDTYSDIKPFDNQEKGKGGSVPGVRDFLNQPLENGEEATFRGVVVDRSVRENKISCLSVQDEDAYDRIEIYIDHGKFSLEFGILPGRLVLCRRLTVEFSAKYIPPFCKFGQFSSIEATSDVGPCISEGLVDSENRLVDFWRQPMLGRVSIRVRCVLRNVCFVKLGWTCQECGGRIMRSVCESNCAARMHAFHAVVRCIVHDGTAEASVDLEGPAALNLLFENERLDEVKRRILREGPHEVVLPQDQILLPQIGLRAPQCLRKLGCTSYISQPLTLFCIRRDQGTNYVHNRPMLSLRALHLAKNSPRRECAHMLAALL